MANLFRKYIVLVMRKDLAPCLLFEMAGMFDTPGEAKVAIEETPHYKKMVPFFIVEADLLQSPVVVEDRTIITPEGQPIAKPEEKIDETPKEV